MRCEVTASARSYFIAAARSAGRADDQPLCDLGEVQEAVCGLFVPAHVRRPVLAKLFLTVVEVPSFLHLKSHPPKRRLDRGEDVAYGLWHGNLLLLEGQGLHESDKELKRASDYVVDILVAEPRRSEDLGDGRLVLCIHPLGDLCPKTAEESISEAHHSSFQERECAPPALRRLQNRGDTSGDGQ